MIDNRLLVNRIVKELKEAVSRQRPKYVVGDALNMFNRAQIALLMGIVYDLEIGNEQDEDELIMEVVDYVEENSPLRLNINSN